MNQFVRLVIWTGCASFLAVYPGNAAQADDKQNYSGKYASEPAKTAATGETGSTLEVVQSSTGLEITTVELGKRATSRCPFDGSEGDYTSPGGASGKCKAQMKGSISFSSPSS
jgi:hypothetical protein